MSPSKESTVYVFSHNQDTAYILSFQKPPKMHEKKKHWLEN